MEKNNAALEDNSVEKYQNFADMELDDRILKALAKLCWETPTLIQKNAIPLLIEGKDVLLRARTGSGKTAAFAIPAIQKILTSKQVAQQQETKALVLAPSKELCHQIWKAFKDLTLKCSREVRCVDLASQDAISAQKPLLVEKPDLIIGTPSRILQFLKDGSLCLKKSLEVLIIDEADLIFSFGYKDEVTDILTYLPKIYQAVLASATLSDDVTCLKKLVLHNPVILKLEEPDLASAGQLTHYHLFAEELDKATILYALLKLHLVRGKTIIFVNTVDKCYKIRLFLEQFGIPTCVLNSELPAAVRCHSVSQFNQGMYDIIIASDEKALEEPGSATTVKTKRRKDKESGVSRGIDFQHVANVINFDFPLDVSSYIHRAGRTARGNNQGSVLSFVSIQEKPRLEEVEAKIKEECGEASAFQYYQFKLEEVQAFKYRAKDAWRAVTRIAVRESRLKEIKQEILNCQKLKGYFEDNPNDLKVLRHDKALHTVKIQPHLKDVPEYILPPTMKSLAGITKMRRKHSYTPDSSSAKHRAKKHNPLLNMQFEGFSKKKK